MPAWPPCTKCAPAWPTRVPPQCRAPPCALLLHNARQSAPCFPPLTLPLPSSRCRSRPAPWPPWPSSTSPRPRCSALPLSKPLVPSYSSHHAAPPTHPRRPCYAPQRCCHLLSSPRPPTCVARPRRASSEQAADTYGCAWTHRCSPAPQTPTEWPPPAGAAIPGDPLLQIRVRDLARQFDESQGPSCNVIDSSE